MTNVYRGHAIDASYQVSVHLAKRFQRKRFFRIDQPEKRTSIDIRPDLHKAASVIRSNQLAREVFMF